MAGFSKTQYKAIAWYAEQNNATPQLSAFPKAYFRNKETGKEFSGDVFALENLYKAAKREEAAEARRVKKLEAKKK